MNEVLYTEARKRRTNTLRKKLGIPFELGGGYSLSYSVSYSTIGVKLFLKRHNFELGELVISNPWEFISSAMSNQTTDITYESLRGMASGSMNIKKYYIKNTIHILYPARLNGDTGQILIDNDNLERFLLWIYFDFKYTDTWQNHTWSDLLSALGYNNLIIEKNDET